MAKAILLSDGIVGRKGFGIEYQIRLAIRFFQITKFLKFFTRIFITTKNKATDINIVGDKYAQKIAIPLDNLAIFLTA